MNKKNHPWGYAKNAKKPKTKGGKCAKCACSHKGR